MGVATGCGCKEVYRFPHTTYPYSCICSFFAAASLLFVHKKNIYIDIYIHHTYGLLVPGAPPPVNALRANVKPVV